MSAAKAFGKHFGTLILLASMTIFLMMLLMFSVILPFFQQLFGELVYIEPDNIWIFGLIAILFTFGISFVINYYYAHYIGGIRTVKESRSVY